MKILENIDYEIYLVKILEFSGEILPKIIWAIFCLWLGLFIIKKINLLIHKGFEKVNFDEALESFLESFASIGLKILLFISIASMLGVETTSLAALLGAAGLAVGLALQGSLSNLAGGVLILIFKPFKIGDYIEAQGFSGTVKTIQIFSTILKTPDNKKVILPNGNLSNDPLINYSANNQRRVDFVFGIGYDDDLKQAKKVLEKIITSEKRVLKNKDVLIAVGNLGDNSVDLYVRIWVKTNDYWDVYYDVTEKVKLEFDAEKISFPYPQRDVHLFQEK